MSPWFFDSARTSLKYCLSSEWRAGTPVTNLTDTSGVLPQASRIAARLSICEIADLTNINTSTPHLHV